MPTTHRLPALALAAALWTTGCGGCYHTGTPQDFKTAPDTPCLQFQAAPVSACTGGHMVTVTNHCSDTVAFDVGSAAPGGSVVVAGQANGPFDAQGRLFFEAKVGTVPVHVSYVIR